MNPYILIIPLSSSLLTFGLCIVMRIYVPGRFSRDFILASGSSGLWAFAILVELAMEHFVLDPILRDPSAWALSAASAFWLVKIASMLAGCSSACVPFFCLLMALNFPPRFELGVWRIPTYIFAVLMAGMSWWGVKFELTNGGIVRTPGAIVFAQMIAWFLVGGMSLGIFAFKARDFSSPLRSMEARYVPVGMLGAFIVGGGLGYGSTFLADGIGGLIAATAGPAVFVAIVVTGFTFSRELFASDLNGLPTIRASNTHQTPEQVVQQLRDQDIHVSYFSLKNERYFDPLWVELVVPAEIKRASISGRFYREEYDDLPETPPFEFVNRSYVQAGIFCEAGLLLVHRIGSGKIVTSRHLDQLRNLFESDPSHLSQPQ